MMAMKSSGKLSFNFDQHLLLKDLNKAESDWIGHFNTDYYSGDWSGIQLRAPKNESNSISPSHSSNKEYKNLPVLNSLEYIREVLETIETPKDSIRFLKLASGSEIKPHKDFDLIFWDGFVRLHVPILTNDKVKFILDGELLNMQPGECWFGDFSKTHSVINEGSSDRIHLVIDCQVNDWLRGQFEACGILEKEEQALDPLIFHNDELKRMMIQELERMEGEGAKLAIEKIKNSIRQ
ncbi:MAG: aspartyl beta-hydroxylase [Cytophagales bacterium CG12_big_fil_rev_8_21_14_0_65_40_12]|nr:MAG: aspartyl beta-hydroxylase [Cytophagales bacterium CG12_big_fil_rev_8_21_14_0_65_40_12]PIW03562.1 MAG: hypothetical protein COW40_14285 [Cytophagales bacterium CG17_big_fil_post_rev_8_21_14_2_50_40_13]